MSAGTLRPPDWSERTAKPRHEIESKHDEDVKETKRTLRMRREAYRLVDIRDKGQCRACGAHTQPFALDPMKCREHHHIRGRQVKDAETTRNICCVCKNCHDLRHVKRVLTVTGNADQVLTFELDGKVWHG